MLSPYGSISAGYQGWLDNANIILDFCSSFTRIVPLLKIFGTVATKEVTLL
jgi:hypothetical protein